MPTGNPPINVEAFLDEIAEGIERNHQPPTTTSNGARDRDRNDDRDRNRDRDHGRDRNRGRDHRNDKNKESKKDGDVEMKDALDSDRSNDTHRSNRRRSRSPRRRGHDDRRGGDYWRRGGRSRSRSRSPDRYYRPGGRGGRRDGDRDGFRDRDRNGHNRGGRAPRRGSQDEGSSPRARRKTPEPQPTEDERDKRTVFVQQLAARLETRHLFEFFSKVGKVKDAQIVKDRVSQRSKGVGYVEFFNEESVPLAIQLTGQKLKGVPIIAQLTEAEKNRQARAEGNPSASSGVPFHRLYVGNIHFSITESDLQNVFEPFGELEFVQLQKEEAGRSRGYGFVQFRDPAQAKEALEKMNGFELAGRPIRVGLGNDKFTPESTANLLRTFNGQAQPQFQGSAFSGHGGRGIHAGGAGGNFDRAGGRENDRGAGGASALDDTDVAGVNFSNYSRDSLMRKLARTDDTPAAGASQPQARPAPRKAPPPQSTASRCIVLKNMYNLAEQTEENWQSELEQDVKLECQDKYGKVIHVGIDTMNPGEVYVKFAEVEGGKKAMQGLNGRFFGGQMITAEPVSDAMYNTRFPKSVV